jgi:TonB family protein
MLDRMRVAIVLVLGSLLVVTAHAPEAQAAPPTSYKCGKGGKAQKKKHACKCPKGKVPARNAKDAAVCVVKPKAEAGTEAGAEVGAAAAAGTTTDAPPEIVHEYGKGEIDLVKLRSQLNRRKRTFESCYQARLGELLEQYPDEATRPKLEGTVMVLFEVESSGVPRRISVVPPRDGDETALNDPSLNACVVRTLERMKLKLEVQREGRFRYPFVFEPYDRR